MSRVPPLPPGVSYATPDRHAECVAIAGALDRYAILLRAAYEQYAQDVPESDFVFHTIVGLFSGTRPEEMATSPALRAALLANYMDRRGRS